MFSVKLWYHRSHGIPRTFLVERPSNRSGRPPLSPRKSIVLQSGGARRGKRWGNRRGARDGLGKVWWKGVVGAAHAEKIELCRC